MLDNFLRRLAIFFWSHCSLIDGCCQQIVPWMEEALEKNVPSLRSIWKFARQGEKEYENKLETFSRCVRETESESVISEREGEDKCHWEREREREREETCAWESEMIEEKNLSKAAHFCRWCKSFKKINFVVFFQCTYSGLEGTLWSFGYHFSARSIVAA